MARTAMASVLLLMMMLPSLIRTNELFSVCGQPVLSPRIVGGQDSKIGAWPWQVSIRYKGQHFCAGSLVAEQWVVSAAHCFQWNPQSALTVTVGEYQVDNPSPNARTIQVVQVISNIAFSGEGTLGDIALLQLQRPLKYTPYILPVCIPDPSTEFPEGMNCWVTGWGFIGDMEPLPTPYTLQEVEVALISVEKCNELYNVSLPNSEDKVTIVDEAICAGYEAGEKDACQGDSGGPLVCAHNSSWFLVGIVSWGEGCAKPFRPGVYTRVTAYAKWLQRHARGLQFGVIPVTLTAGGSNFSFLAGSSLFVYSVALLLPVLQLQHECMW